MSILSREEALKLADYNETPYYFQSLVKKIYDSIGTCRECDRWLKHPNNDFGACWLVQLDEDNLWHKDDYCSKFERKVD